MGYKNCSEIAHLLLVVSDDRLRHFIADNPDGPCGRRCRARLAPRHQLTVCI